MSEKKFPKITLKTCEEPISYRDNLLSRVMISATKSLSPRFQDRKESKKPHDDIMVNMLFSSISGFSSFS